MPRGFYSVYDAMVLLLMCNILYIYVAITFVGATGETCNTCCQGLAGQSGNNGVPGIPGSHGREGSVGRDGVKGDRGHKGDRGETGSGEHGPKGIQGPSGDRGLPGLRGLPGKIGPVGVPGPVGPIGPIGPQGVEGESGRIGKSAFTVYKKTQQIAASDGEVITFEEAPVNIGSHFDLSTNRFTCHFAGIYFFYYSVHVIGANNPDINLIKDGNTVGVTARSELYKVQIGTATLLHLEVGNQVWLHFGNGREGIAGGYGQFIGYLLYDLV